jgi:hypothetical protein
MPCKRYARRALPHYVAAAEHEPSIPGLVRSEHRAHTVLERLECGADRRSATCGYPVALGGTMEDDGRASLPARLDLSLRGNSIASSFYCGKGERHGKADLPTAEVVQAIERARRGDDLGIGDCQRMRDTILSCLPQDSLELLKSSAQGLPEESLVELEIRVNDRALENYPWELLAEPGLLAPPETEVAVWRSVMTSLPDERQASTAVLLAGSVSLDSVPPFAREEVDEITQLLREYRWVKPRPYPSVTFGDFSKILEVIRPAVVHVVVHGSTDGFNWQASRTLSESHYTITPQELAGCLARSGTAVAVLSACDSATASAENDPAARLISEKRGATTIGMTAELPARIGIAFAKDFYRELAVGSTVIEAHSHAVRSIRGIPDSANLWSVPVMYSSSPNLVIFPAGSYARARLSFDEVSGHLEKLGTELGAVADHRDWNSGNWAENTAAPAMRITYVQDVLTTLTKILDERPADLGYAIRLGQGCADLERSLADIRSCLDQLTHSASSGQERKGAANMVTDRLERIRKTIQRISLLFLEMP